MSRVKLELHDIVQTGREIEAELNRAIDESAEKRVSFLEIVFDKDSGELKKRVLRFLAQPKLQKLYHRIEKDDKNYGRIFVHFRLRSQRKIIGLHGYEKTNQGR